ncbi:MAG: hypothetical protein U5N26_05185 [Candidatus Marinimicrobia bacterium]|nr:hypothetical protein [Candidatus Neomarinimicrobiota bacterium]
MPLRVQVSGLTGSVSYVFDVEDPFNTDYYPVSGSTAAIRVPASGSGASYHVLNEGRSLSGKPHAPDRVLPCEHGGPVPNRRTSSLSHRKLFSRRPGGWPDTRKADLPAR